MPTEVPPLLRETATGFFLNSTLGANLTMAAIIFAVSLLFAGLVRRAIRLATRRRTSMPPVAPLLNNLIYWSILLFGVTASLQAVGIDLTAVIAGLGILGFTIGFALQDLSKNIISGVMLLLSEPFRTGDTIEVSGYTGLVNAITLRTTELRTLDGRIVLIPNADVVTRPITNFSRTQKRRLEFNLGVPYGTDLEAVRAAILQAIEQIPDLGSEAAPQVIVNNFNSQAVEMIVYLWVDARKTDPALARDAGLVAVYAALDQLGINISQRQFIHVENILPGGKNALPG